MTLARSLLVVLLLGVTSPALAQSIGGIVLYADGAWAANVLIVAEDAETGRQVASTRSSGIGAYELSLRPGRYRLLAWPAEFEPVIKIVTVRSGHIEAVNITLELRRAEHVTVPPSGKTAAPADTGTSTDDVDPTAMVVTREMIDFLPVNDRSLQGFLALLPGIVLTDSTGTLGTITTGGQRRFSHAFDIDGANARVSVSLSPPGYISSGSLVGQATSGGTQILVPTEAIEKIVLHPSTASVEHRRSPGAQTTVRTRSGSNQWSGSSFADLRPSSLAASSWADNNTGIPRRRTSYFNGGGSVGGPVLMGRIFQFISLERLAVDRPIAQAVPVPSQAIRDKAPDVQQRVLRAFPMPNGRELGGGLTEYRAAFPVASNASALSVRVDANIRNGSRLFVRGNYGTSAGDALDAFNQPAMTFGHEERTITSTTTIDLVSRLTSSLSLDLTANVSRHYGAIAGVTAPYGGAQDLPLGLLLPQEVAHADATVGLTLFPGPGGRLIDGGLGTTQKQIEIISTLGTGRGWWRWRMGGTYRRLASVSDGSQVRYEYRFQNLDQFLKGGIQFLAIERTLPTHVIRHHGTWFLQGTFDLSSRLSLNMGLRHDIQSPPVNRLGIEPTLVQLDALPRLHFLPPGSQPWRTRWTDFAPRLALAYRFGDDRQTLVRAAWGWSFDHLNGVGAVGYGNYPFVSTTAIKPQGFPVPADVLMTALDEPAGSTQSVNYTAFPADLRTPRTYDWTLSVSRDLGARRRVNLAYVGAAGRDLLYRFAYYSTDRASSVEAFGNLAQSDFHGLTLDYEQGLCRGFQARVTWTWSHTIDTDSGEPLRPNPPPEYAPVRDNRGNADFDRRHVLGITGSYQFPSAVNSKVLRLLSGDLRLVVAAALRSSGPFSVAVARDAGYGPYVFRPDVVPDVPLWLSDATAPGGRRLNPDAFMIAKNGHGTLGRNSLRAWPLRQIDGALVRSLRLKGRAVLQMHLAVFNLLNTAHFGLPDRAFGSFGFGRPFHTYAESLGAGTLIRGGLTPVHQAGGPRVVQFSMRFRF